MLKTSSGQAGQFLVVNYPIPILVADGYVRRSFDLHKQTREAQATLVHDDQLFTSRSDFWIIKENDLCAKINCEQSVKKSHLVSSKTYATFLSHEANDLFFNNLGICGRIRKVPRGTLQAETLGSSGLKAELH